jgi:hypothetical protein
MIGDAVVRPGTDHLIADCRCKTDGRDHLGVCVDEAFSGRDDRNRHAAAGVVAQDGWRVEDMT